MIQPKQTLRGIERIAHPVKAREGYVTLERNERTIDVAPEVLQELRSLMTGLILRAYPELDAFYEALASWSGYSTAELLATDGADGGLHRVFASYVSEGDEVVILSPSYAMYPVYGQMYGARMRPLAFNERLELPFERVWDAATPGTRLIALVNPNQPIECCYTFDELRQLAQRCAERDILLLVDEAYYHFCPITAAPLVRTFDNVVVVRTFSKAFGLAGLRIGYVIAAPPVIKVLRALKPIYEVNHLNAAIATYFLKRPALMESYVASVREGWKVLTTYCARQGWATHGRHSNTLLVALPQHLVAPRIVTRLAQAGWLIRAETQPPTPNHLRITLGPPEQMEALCRQITMALHAEEGSLAAAAPARGL